MKLNSAIFNDNVSYTGDEIKKWCEFHIKRDGEYEIEAREILDYLWGKHANKKRIPRNEVYYFVCMAGIPDIKGYPQYISDIWLDSDHIKSPKIFNNSYLEW